MNEDFDVLATDDEEEKKYLESLLRTRGFAEHEILANGFFDEPRKIIVAMLLGQGKFLSSVYNTMMPDKYHESDFSVKPLKIGDMLYAVAIPPEPENKLDCMIIAMGADTKGEHPAYYTVERREDGGYYLCCKHDKEIHCILAVDCGDTLEENLKVLWDYLHEKHDI